jgi:hypothetical protein
MVKDIHRIISMILNFISLDGKGKKGGGGGAKEVRIDLTSFFFFIFN